MLEMAIHCSSKTASTRSSPEAGPEQKILELPAASSEEAKPAAPEGIEAPGSDKAAKQQPQRSEMLPASAGHASELVEVTPFEVTQSELPQKREGFFRERPPQVIEVAPQMLRLWTRRDVLLFGAGALVGGWLSLAAKYTQTPGRFRGCDISRVCNHAVPCLKKPFCDSAANAS